MKNKVWFFTSFEAVHEDASIAYSPASTTQFQALAQLASQGLITGVPSISVPANVPIPFRDYIASVRFDWAQSPKSSWFLRTSADSYLTHNALVQQGTLPSTGLTTHNNYWNVALSNTYTFSPTWLGNLVLDASLLHLTQARNSDLGFALAFPFSSTALTISGFETFGDNQFATPITLFPDLRNQEKYQFRYDLSHVAGSHGLKFGVDFIHEPVLSGAFASTAETLAQYVNNPDLLCPKPRRVRNLHPAVHKLHRFGRLNLQFHSRRRRNFFAECSAARVLRRGLLAHLASTHGQLRPALSDHLGIIRQVRAEAKPDNSAYITLRHCRFRLCPAFRRITASRSRLALGSPTLQATARRLCFAPALACYYDDLAQNGWATAFQGINNTNFTTGTCALTGGPGTYALVGAGCLTGRRRGHGQSDRLPLQNALRDSYDRRRAARFQRTLARQRRLCARAGQSWISRFPLYQRHQPIHSAHSHHRPELCHRSNERRAQRQRVPVRQPFQLQRADVASARQYAPLQSGRELHALQSEDLGMPAGRAI